MHHMSLFFQKKGEITRFLLAILTLLTLSILGIVLSDASQSTITGLVTSESESHSSLWTIAPFLFASFIFLMLIVASVQDKKKSEKVKQVVEYVANSRAVGYKDHEIKQHLSSSGWDEKTIQDALQN